MALDLFGLEEYAKINPGLRNLDTLYAFLVESDVIPQEVLDRCEIDFSLTSRNLQIVLSARTGEDEEFCSTTSMRVAEVIDNPNTITTYVPDSFQFATAAVAGPYVPGSDSSGSDSSAMGVALHSSLFISALVFSSISAVL